MAGRGAEAGCSHDPDPRQTGQDLPVGGRQQPGELGLHRGDVGLQGLPVEPELARWFALWGLPLG
jgi:hypothetical protein